MRDARVPLRHSLLVLLAATSPLSTGFSRLVLTRGRDRNACTISPRSSFIIVVSCTKSLPHPRDLARFLVS